MSSLLCVYIVGPDLASARALQMSNHKYLGQFSHDHSSDKLPRFLIFYTIFNLIYLVGMKV